MGFEPTTSTLARLRSTPELYPHSVERDINYHIRKKMQALILNFCNFFYSHCFRKQPDNQNTANNQSHTGNCRRIGFLMINKICRNRNQNDSQTGPYRISRSQLNTGQTQAQKIKGAAISESHGQTWQQYRKAVCRFKKRCRKNLADDCRQQINITHFNLLQTRGKQIILPLVILKCQKSQAGQTP